MSTQLKLRRGTTAQHAVFAGANGEVTVDTDKSTVVVHDGATLGGAPMAKASQLVASSIAYLPAGTGAATDLTVQDGLRRTVNILYYYANGVSGDRVDPAGVIDSTLGFQAAIDYLASVGGGCIDIPEGTYLISQITLKDHVTLAGYNRENFYYTATPSGSMLQKAGTTGDMIITAAYPAVTRWAGLKNLVLLGNPSATSGKGVDLSQGTVCCFVHNCAISGFANQGLVVGGWVHSISRVFVGFNNIYQPSLLTTYTGNVEVLGTDNVIEKCEFHGSTALNEGDPVVSASLYDVAALILTANSWFRDCNFEKADIGGLLIASSTKSTGAVGKLDPYYPNTCLNNTFVGCRADYNAGHGVVLQATSAKNGPYTNRFIGCWSESNSQAGANLYSGFAEFAASGNYPQANVFTGCSTRHTASAIKGKYGFDNSAVQALQTSVQKSVYSGCLAEPTSWTTAAFSGTQYEQHKVALGGGMQLGTYDFPYAEGLFTPTLTFATPGNLDVVYTTASTYGSYTRIGNRVFYNLRIVTSTFTHTTASGNLQILGLPITVGTPTAGTQNSAGVCNFSGFVKAGAALTSNPVQGTSVIQVSFYGSGLAAGSITAADVPTGGNLVISLSGHYTA